MRQTDPGSRRQPIIPLLLAASVSLSLLAMAAIAVLPARPPSAALNQLLVMHNALIAGRSHIDQPVSLPRDEHPVVEREANGVLDDREIQSWLYRLEREVFTVHRLADDSLIPRSASRLPVGERRVAFFEIEDLQALAWPPEPGQLVLVLGTGTLATQLRLARWIDTNPPAIQGRQ